MIYVKESMQHGRGVFAKQPIAAGIALLVFKGPLVGLRELDVHDYHLQIGPDLYLGASGEADDYVNHSCDPNCGFGPNLTLYTLRSIAADEEITWDYSCAIDEDDFAGFPCYCGASHCRGMVRSFRDLDRADQDRLRPWVLPYLRDRYGD